MGKQPMSTDARREAAERMVVICAEDCTSGCHASDCEHHGHLPYRAAVPGVSGEAELLALSALWDCYVQSGADTDGDDGPRAMIAGMGVEGYARAVVESVKQLRIDYAQALAEPAPASSASRSEMCHIEPAFSQHEYAVAYCETHDQPADQCATPAPASSDGLRAPNDGALDSETTEGQPIESGGWWTPYVETPWGYFRFAVRPVEQPDGLILFWHDAEGGHSQNVVTDLPGDKDVLAERDSLRAALSQEPPTSVLDVERLARAIKYVTFGGQETFGNAMQDAEAIAFAYNADSEAASAEKDVKP